MTFRFAWSPAQTCMSCLIWLRASAQAGSLRSRGRATSWSNLRIIPRRPSSNPSFSACWWRDLCPSSPIQNALNGFRIAMIRFANWRAPVYGCKSLQVRLQEPLAEMPGTGPIGCWTRGMSMSWPQMLMILGGGVLIYVGGGTSPRRESVS
jgi:hypothetical protein